MPICLSSLSALALGVRKLNTAMDFLDPKKRRAYHIRLMVGYVLMAIVIGLATYLLTTAATGYGFNAKTGEVIENGLLFVNSNPSGATIYLNGQSKNTTTPARLILPGGNYSLKLSKTGYRDWSRSFTLNGQSVARYVYPFLFPTKPVITSLKTYDSMPGLVTQSPNQRWLLVEDNTASAATPTFDEYDTTTLDKTTPTVASLSIPANVLTNYSASSVLTMVEWSTDNANVLLKHDYDGGSEFILFNRAHPDQSINVNTTFNLNPSQVNFYNKSADQLYIYNQTDQSLSLADVKAQKVGQPILKHVLYFKPYGKNLINYITDDNQPAGQVAAKIWDSGKTYNLNQFPAGSTYMIDAAQFQGHFYYADGSDKSDRIIIFKDPEADIKDPAIGKALPTIALDIPGATKLKFSNNAAFIGVESGQNFAVYDIETQTPYQYTLSDPLNSVMDWMDGDRWIGDSSGQVLVMDYDGINKHAITATSMPIGAYFSSNYDHLLTVAPSDDQTAFLLKDVDMRAGVDLPKK